MSCSTELVTRATCVVRDLVRLSLDEAGVQ